MVILSVISSEFKLFRTCSKATKKIQVSRKYFTSVVNLNIDSNFLPQLGRWKEKDKC